MKTSTSIGWLLLIWIISLLGFSLFFTIYAASMLGVNKDPDLQVALIVWWLFWGVITFLFALLFSIPALIWFLLTGIGILKTKLGNGIKRFLLVLSNYMGIGASSAIAVVFFIGFASRENKSSAFILEKILAFYPTWSIVVLSTLCILFFPINPKTKSL